MSKVTLEDILETLPLLTPTERQQIRQNIDPTPPSAPMTEDEFHQLMVARGLISLPTQECREEAEAWQPVRISDKPLSEVIIEERR